jgi:carboxymethylenebutenolidase
MSTASMIESGSVEGESRGYYARPGTDVPGVVVIQEWWGIVPHIEDVTRRLAAQGYLAIAPDLYHGRKTRDPKEAERLMQQMDWGRAAVEIAAAVGYLRKQGATRVGVTGFCMGGALTIIGAASANVEAYAAFYGFPPPGGVRLENIQAPGLIFFGEHEDFFSVPDAMAFAERQTARGYPTEVVRYPGAGHAFFNDTRPEAYQAEAANDAWRRTLAFFAEQLRR